MDVALLMLEAAKAAIGGVASGAAGHATTALMRRSASSEQETLSLKSMQSNSSGSDDVGLHQSVTFIAFNGSVVFHERIKVNLNING